MATGRERPATINDVARLADVSVPTVSRVLTGAARVSEARRRRVLDAIADLQYRPSAAAQVLASRRSNVIGIVAGDTSRYGYAESIRGVEESARAAGFLTFIVVVGDSGTQDVDAATDAVLRQSPAGVVVLEFDPAGVAALAALQQHVPVVALSGMPREGVPHALLDESNAAATITQHLLALGHTTVHHVRVPTSGKEDGRTIGWRRALLDAGAPVPEILDTTWDPQTAYTVGLGLAAEPEVTAVFCGNDETAMGVIRGLHDAGRRVPHDLSVAGFDDHPLAAMFLPSITTARQDFAELGRHGFVQLQALMTDGQPLALETVDAPIVIRESTGPRRS